MVERHRDSTPDAVAGPLGGPTHVDELGASVSAIRSRSSSTVICSVRARGRPAWSHARIPPARYPATFSRPTRASRVRVSPTRSSSSATSTIGLRRHQRARPGGELAGLADLERARDVPGAVLGRRARVEDDGSRLLQPGELLGRKRGRRRKLVEGSGPFAIQRRVAREVGRRLRQIRRDETDELLARHGAQRPVKPALLADGRARLAGNIAAAERPGAVRGNDLHLVGQLEQLLVERVVTGRPGPRGSRGRREGPAGRRRR